MFLIDCCLNGLMQIVDVDVDVDQKKTKEFRSRVIVDKSTSALAPGDRHSCDLNART